MSSCTLAIILSFPLVERTILSLCSHRAKGVCLRCEATLCQGGGHVVLVVSLWLRLTMGQIWFKAVLMSHLPLLLSRKEAFNQT